MIELRSRNLKAHILPYGATLSGLWHKSAPYSLVIGSADTEVYKRQLAYCGAVVGPIANRISGASIALDGANWHMDANEGSTCLHSGPTGLHAREWSIVSRSNTSVELGLVLEHGETGLPGKRELSVLYEVSDAGEMSVHMRARTDRETLMNMAHHPYWCLDNAAKINHHQLKINARQYLPVSDQKVPTGEIRPVAGTNYDFTKSRYLPVDRTIDENFCLATDTRPEPEKAAVLSADCGLSLTIETTQPGLQVYNGSGLLLERTRLHDGKVLQPFAGIALEPQHWPDAPKHTAFPTIVLKPIAEYVQHTIYKIC